MNALISIIIPAYNREKYIGASIRSALSQTYSPIEVLVIDDGSTDKTLQIARSFSEEGVRVFSAGHQGASAARNLGLREAKGEYIQFLDSDDLLNPEKIAAQVNLLKSMPGHLATCSTVHFYDGEDWLAKQPGEYEDRFLGTCNDPVDFLVKLWGGYDENGSMVSSNAWLVPRTILDVAGYWNESLSFDDDGEFFTRVILQSSGIVYSKDSLNYYRKYRGNSLSDLNSAQKFSSILNSALAKKNALLARTDSEPAKLAIHKMLMNIAVKGYPQYPSIYRAALKELPEISLAYALHVGGPLTNKISGLFGWKIARILQYLRSKLT